MMKIKYAAVIYKIGVYVSLLLIGVSLLVSLILPTHMSKEHVKIDFSNFLHGIITLDPVVLLYLASLILVFSPLITVVYLLFCYVTAKKYGNFLISLILILIFSCVVILKVV